MSPFSAVTRLPHRLLLLLSACLVAFIVWLSQVESAVALPVSARPVLASLFHFSGQRPDSLGVEDGGLRTCPPTPNCVSSQSQDGGHAIAPLKFDSTPDAAMSQLQRVIEGQPQAKIISNEGDYLYAEFTSSLMGFVDDVEFYLDRQAGEIQVRSASRLGESDLGVNRKRVETIRQKFRALQALSEGLNLQG
jgi:uncharacterized protein (DUF1499 family)